MYFESALPSLWLGNIVRQYWTAAYSAEDRQALPAHYPAAVNLCLIFSLDRRFSIQRKNEDFTLVPRSFLIGHLTQPYFLDNHDAGAFGVDLHHSALYRLWGLPVAEFSDTYTDLESIFGQVGADLTEQIVLAKNFRERIQIIEAFFTSVLPGPGRDRRWADLVLNLMRQSGGTLPMADLADRSHLSYRQFNRKFEEQIGITPKLYANLTRFNAAFRELGQGEKVDWRLVLHRYGYYDQAHFIKEFNRFTGLAPRRYFNNGFHRFSQHFIATPRQPREDPDEGSGKKG